MMFNIFRLKNSQWEQDDTIKAKSRRKAMKELRKKGIVTRYNHGLIKVRAADES